MPKKTTPIRTRFGRWLVLSQAPSRNGHHTYFMCRCDCGTIRVHARSTLETGRTHSCGCLARELSSDRKRTHGMSTHKLFPVWNSMMSRCYKNQDPAFERYGGRGISVCRRWHDVRNFIADNEHFVAPGLSMDRKNNNRGYTRQNVRWVDAKTQSRNRRNVVMATYKGRTKPLVSWATELGLNPKTILTRVTILGWPVREALETPISKFNRRSSLVSWKGHSITLPELARKHSICPLLVRGRLERGWSLEKALTTPNRHRSIGRKRTVCNQY